VTLLESLLDAIIRLDGEALVMHVGEKPYITTGSSSLSSHRGPLSWGQVELSSRPLTTDAVLGMLGQMLTQEQRRMLYEVGAVEDEIDAPGDSGEKFIFTAARGGDDVWVEVRRKPKPIEPAVEVAPAFVPAQEAPVHAAEPPFVLSVTEPETVPESPPVEAPEAPQPEVVMARAPQPVMEPAAAPAQAGVETEHELSVDMELEVLTEADFEIEPRITEFRTEWEPQLDSASTPPQPLADFVSEMAADDEPETEVLELPALVAGELGEAWAEIDVSDHVAPTPPSAPRHEAAATQVSAGAEPDVVEVALPAAVVLPLARPSLKLQPPQPAPPTPAASTEASLVELLRTAVACGASMVYAVEDSRPMVRVDAGIAPLGTEPVVTGADVERFAFEFAPREQVADAPTEWTCVVSGVGRVRCVRFRDQSGAGLIFHLPSSSCGTADELRLEPQIQSLCEQADGLVVVAGPRSSGKSTLLTAFVDLINRDRYDHVITIESEIRVVHEKRRSFISQREVHGDGEALADAARAALREGPDVLVIEDLGAPEAIAVALDGARAGRLVFGAIAAPTAAVAVQRLIDAFAADRRPQIRALLASALRAVVAQVLVERAGGGRAGARELLLSSPAVSKLVLDGAIEQLPIAIDGGRRLGMMTMVDSLGALVREGIVEPAAACRRAPDRAALVAALRRDGIDVSGLERRA
jgi:twitching motility protein PilT